ncbi:MAG: sterol desaturase family protein [Planctomycetota bacterium]
MEATVRLGVFFAVLTLMGTWEIILPRRTLTVSKLGRWLRNLGMSFLNTAAVRFLCPLLPMALAVLCRERGWGLLNNVALPGWAAVLLAVLALDCAIYLQHVLFHAVPLLWRIHRMHHADMDFDVTTGVRFHPFEILLSMGIKLGLVAALGASALSVLLFEVLLNATSMFNHGNVLMPPSVDALVRLFLVTPDMHRVHHSVVIRETNSNFGFNAPWWDRIFGTYKAQPDAGHEGMTIGLAQYRQAKHRTFRYMLAIPFLGRPVGHPINRPRPSE